MLCLHVVYSTVHSLEIMDSLIMVKYCILITSITQKAHRTYKRILEGADVGILWSYVVEETGENTDLGRATITLPHADGGDQIRAAASQARVKPLRYSANPTLTKLKHFVISKNRFMISQNGIGDLKHHIL